jgi:hypothetical protein
MSVGKIGSFDAASHYVEYVFVVVYIFLVALLTKGSFRHAKG